MVGAIDELGPDVDEWKEGQRVGVGWHGGHDGTCRACRRGDFRNCLNRKVPGISYDGGYQQLHGGARRGGGGHSWIVSPRRRRPRCCAPLPPPSTPSVPSGCATPGDLVAVLGVGGLGHLGIQFASKFGYKVVAIGRGAEDASFAQKLGASAYLDSRTKNAAAELQKMGGAQVILATAPSAKAMTELLAGLGPNGKLLVIGASNEPMAVAPVQIIPSSLSLAGRYAGTAAGEEDTVRFAELSGVRPLIETYPLERAAEGYARMKSGQAKFRVVLTM